MSTIEGANYARDIIKYLLMLRVINFRNTSKPRHGILQVTVIHTLGTIILE